jgi:hypothetical protein
MVYIRNNCKDFQMIFIVAGTKWWFRQVKNFNVQDVKTLEIYILHCHRYKNKCFVKCELKTFLVGKRSKEYDVLVQCLHVCLENDICNTLEVIDFSSFLVKTIEFSILVLGNFWCHWYIMMCHPSWYVFSWTLFVLSVQTGQKPWEQNVVEFVIKVLHFLFRTIFRDIVNLITLLISTKPNTMCKVQ